MNILVVGASGATGKLLVDQLLNMEQSVSVIMRSASNIPDNWNSNDKVSIIEANVSEISLSEMRSYVKDCQSIAICLGHNLTLKGTFGKPRKLITDAVTLICAAIQEVRELPKKGLLLQITCKHCT